MSQCYSDSLIKAVGKESGIVPDSFFFHESEEGLSHLLAFGLPCVKSVVHFGSFFTEEISDLLMLFTYFAALLLE